MTEQQSLDPTDPHAPRPLAASQDALLDALAAGATVATGNARLARSLAAAYERRMLADGRAAWATPAVLPLPAWLRQLWEEASLAATDALPRVLGPEQEEQAWAAAIRAGGAAPALLRVDATARRARQAWALVRDFQLDLGDRRFRYGENPEAFLRWAQAFEAACRARGEAAAADLPDLLAQPGSRLREARGALPPRLVLTGFYALTPALQALAKALDEAGCDVAWMELQGEPGAAVRLQADDPRHEIALAADWARGILRQRPDARIGIVVPDLEARRAGLAHALRARLDPASLAPGAAPGPRPWNISLGRPLAEFPVVATALRLLSLLRPPADTATLGLLLLSPHWALPEGTRARREELHRRALLDRRLRAIGDARMPLSSLRFHAGGGADADAGPGQARPWHSPRLAARVEALIRTARELPARDDAAGWAAAFSAWLKAADWAAYGDGGRPLDSHEYQAIEAWHGLLSRFSSLSDYAGSLESGEALTLLRRLAAETLFQPRAGDAAVQVLGLYEAIGQSFDQLWVMGLHDGAWPPAPGPDPFIPIAIQRERGLPHSGPEAELEWARQVTGRLHSAAAEVVFSWPGRDGDAVLQCSPLIASLPLRSPAELRASLPLEDEPGWAGRVRRSAAAEPPPGLEPVPLAAASARGGSRVFADQAACPFRAFAVHRLGAAPLERPQAGLNAMRRGTLVHRVLARLWDDLGSQASLLALDEPDLRARVRGHVEAVLEAERRRSPATFPARFQAVEARRLEQRALDWLELERERSPFRVAATELPLRFETGGLEVRLTLDRVDELQDGARLVLDYKTGKVTPSAWFGERPEEPQLPLYGVAARRGVPRGAGSDGDAPDGDGPHQPAQQPVAGVAFAQLQPGGNAFRGVVREAGLLPGLPANRKGPLQDATEHWPAVLDEWAAELERLAEAFRAGTAEVDPKRGLTTCSNSWCELGPLCRVRESLRLADDADDIDMGAAARAYDDER